MTVEGQRPYGQVFKGYTPFRSEDVLLAKITPCFENGKIAFPVHEVTIAGNVREMFASIEAVGADAYTMGSKTIGSVLIGKMKIAGD